MIESNEESGAISLLDQQHTTTEHQILPECYIENDPDGDPATLTSTSKSGGASLLSSIITLTNTVMGAGMLGLPGAFAGCGTISGSILLLLAGLGSANGLRLLSISAETVGMSEGSSFYRVANASIPRYTILIDLAVAMKCFGVATSYFITFSDCMVDAMRYLQGPELLISRYFWVSCALVLVLPISFFRTLDALKFTSTLSLVLIFSLAVGIVLFAEGVEDPCEGFEYSQQAEESVEVARLLMNSTTPEVENCRGDTTHFESLSHTLQNLPIFVFSFTCQQNIFGVLNELRNRTPQRINRMIGTCLSTAFILYIIVAVAGYGTYGDNVASDILLNYPNTRLVTIMRVCIAIMMALSYPLQLDPSRRCLFTLISSIQSMINGDKKMESTVCCSDSENDGFSLSTTEKLNLSLDELSLERPINQAVPQPTTLSTTNTTVSTTSNTTFRIVTIIFLLLSYTLAMVIQDLGVVLAVVGATGSTMVAYILPGAIYWNLHDSGSNGTMMGLAALQFTIGCLIVPTSLYYIIFG